MSIGHFSESLVRDIYHKILPKVADKFGLDKMQVRLPTALEYHLLKTLHDNDWGGSGTDEWFHEVTQYKSEGSVNPKAGFYGDEKKIDFSEQQRPDIGFRPMFVLRA